jgi:predicted acylesterase/phospholipase RssA
MHIENLVFSGGQLKGLAYAGVLKALYKKKINISIKNILGVSSGAIFALAFVLKLTVEQIIEIVHKLNILNLNSLNYESMINFFDTYGFDDCKRIEKFIKILIKKTSGKDNLTFKELYDKTGLNLIIMGTNLTEKKGEFFNYKYSPDMPVEIAIRISINVPVYFEKFEYKNNLYIDGGIICNYPMYYFDKTINKTLGIALQDTSPSNNKSNFLKYLYSILNILVQNTEKRMYKLYKKNTIFIQVRYNITDMDFELDTKKYLINEGYIQTLKYLEKIEQNETILGILNNLIEKLIENSYVNN